MQSYSNTHMYMQSLQVYPQNTVTISKYYFVMLLKAPTSISPISSVGSHMISMRTGHCGMAVNGAGKTSRWKTKNTKCGDRTTTRLRVMRSTGWANSADEWFLVTILNILPLSKFSYSISTLHFTRYACYNHSSKSAPSH